MLAYGRAGSALIAALLVSRLAMSAGDADGEVALQSGNGPAFTVTSDGLAGIRLGQRQVATGGWRLSSGDWVRKNAPGTVDAKAILQKAVERVDARTARVRHVHKHVRLAYTYTVDGDDLAIAARVEVNDTAPRPMGVAMFHGLTFHFGQVPAGVMFHQHGSYLSHHGVGLFHPSFAARIGGSYAVGDGVGVGLSPGGPTLDRTLFWWDYTDWRQGAREKLPTRRLTYLVAAPMLPGSARTFHMKLRVSANTDWKHLLAPYKQHLTALVGPVQYEADHRLMAQACVNRDAKSISPQNPYGFHSGFRRLDLAEGVKAFGDLLVPGLKEAGGQGVLIWGQGGENPRGAMYRPDFDVLPHEVEANWPTLAKRFNDAGLHLGVCARPGELVFPLDRTRDGTLRINAADPAHVNMLWRRFQRMIDRGCSAFYLDTFGSDLNDVNAMRQYRKRMGPKVQTYVEHACDAILPTSGLYTEIYFNKKTGQYGLAWMDVRTWEIFRWLVPGVQCVVKSRVNEKDLPEGFERPYPFLFRHHLTPLVDDWLLRRDLPELKKLTAEHLDAKGQWRK